MASKECKELMREALAEQEKETFKHMTEHTRVKLGTIARLFIVCSVILVMASCISIDATIVMTLTLLAITLSSISIVYMIAREHNIVIVGTQKKGLVTMYLYLISLCLMLFCLLEYIEKSDRVALTYNLLQFYLIAIIPYMIVALTNFGDKKKFKNTLIFMYFASLTIAYATIINIHAYVGVTDESLYVCKGMFKLGAILFVVPLVQFVREIVKWAIKHPRKAGEIVGKGLNKWQSGLAEDSAKDYAKDKAMARYDDYADEKNRREAEERKEEQRRYDDELYRLEKEANDAYYRDQPKDPGMYGDNFY